MGACNSTLNTEKTKQLQEQQILDELRKTREEDETQLNKAKSVIDDLNNCVSDLENELKLLRSKVISEKQRKLEETDKYNKAQSHINTIEAEKLELERKILQISAVNGQALTIDHAHSHKSDNKPDNNKSDDAFGQSQSPINIISSCTSHETNLMKKAEFESNPLKFNYPSKVEKCTILNNGHTVQVNIGSKCTLNINGETYELKQFHFHTPSEHTVDGKQYEMEMHLVHTNEENEIAVLGFIFTTQQKYKKPKLELTKSRAHLVLAKNDKSLIMNNESSLKVMQESEDETSDDMETDDEWDDNDNDKNDNNNKKKKDNKNKKGNDFLAQFWRQLPNEKTEKDIPLEKALSFDYLFESASNNFIKNIQTNEINIDMEIFEYIGSLTTPPYTEGVQWLVSK
eukprot:300454_1